MISTQDRENLIKGDIRKVIQYLTQAPPDTSSSSLLNLLLEGTHKYRTCKGCGEPVHRHLSFCPYCWMEASPNEVKKN